MTKRPLLNECNACHAPVGYDGKVFKVYSDWRGSDPEYWHFCSARCIRNMRLGGGCMCYICGRLLTKYGNDGTSNWNLWSVDCFACAAAHIFKNGQPRSAIATPSSLSETTTDAEFRAVGYTHIPVASNQRELQKVALQLIDARGACVIVHKMDIFLYLYARPHPRYARAAALLLCAAQRLDRGSLLTVLPRDLVVLLGKRVLVAKFAPEWLFLAE